VRNLNGKASTLCSALGIFFTDRGRFCAHKRYSWNLPNIAVLRVNLGSSRPKKTKNWTSSTNLFGLARLEWNSYLLNHICCISLKIWSFLCVNGGFIGKNSGIAKIRVKNPWIALADSADVHPALNHKIEELLKIFFPQKLACKHLVSSL